MGIETKEEKRIIITNNHNGGSELNAVHTASEIRVTVDIRNGSEPMSTILLPVIEMEKLAEWLVERAKEIKKGQE